MQVFYDVSLGRLHAEIVGSREELGSDRQESALAADAFCHPFYCGSQLGAELWMMSEVILNALRQGDHPIAKWVQFEAIFGEPYLVGQAACTGDELLDAQESFNQFAGVGTGASRGAEFLFRLKARGFSAIEQAAGA